ncbi:unnamed protein product [Didymodactylos carnosus]|uniref:Uncharacterized protein n=1 Tax=Didymodactylos carnosus TaxID=1234261 RepID=A0A815SLN8_9BILA|nr:unnamed protein product [Didymodactylos carnosus]CAF1492377.1 unnamed protein product [Didymodactylos carnosus]CAF4013282.1 unnamed protein product [Didymodactylos carnosus]CAF4355239.1 unnamed protein product [Didymodactylos carnosus]
MVSSRIDRIEQNKVYVHFIDSGNCEIITDSSCLTKSPSNFIQLATQVREFELVYIKPSINEDDRQKVKRVLNDKINNEEYLLNIEYRYQDVKYISLYNEGTKDNLAKLVIKYGLIMVNQVKRQQKQ